MQQVLALTFSMTRPERKQQILRHVISKTEETGVRFYVILSILQEIFLELSSANCLHGLYKNRIAHDAIRISRECGNLLLSSTVHCVNQ